MLNETMKKNTIAHLKRGEKGVIWNFSTDVIPVKLQEMGCLPGNEVELIQLSPFKDLLYLNISGSYFAIRKEIAALIEIAKAE
jgi:ferrous iron transport protein A